ncbi:MAG: DUF4876 domain-containing protein [Bacillota bacterium]
MRKIYMGLFVIITAITFLQCDQIIDSEIKPLDKERGNEFKLMLKDESGMMIKLLGTDKVNNALIRIKSNTLGTEYTAMSDSNGLVTFSGIISDDYHISVQREFTADEMQIISGHSASGYRLINKKSAIIRLYANNKKSTEISLDVVFAGSPFIISEMYACGPQGSGLYYHDKYIELYNPTDSVQYLDGLLIIKSYSSETAGLNYRNDPEYIHSESIWYFPGSGKDHPVKPGQHIVCAEDGIDHRQNAPNSVDLSHADFEFYKTDAPDVDNQNVPNLLCFYQKAGNDWLPGGERDAFVIAKIPLNELKPYGTQYLIPYSAVLDGIEYMKDPTKLEKKTLNDRIDAGSTGGIQFYTGKSMERIQLQAGGKSQLLDNNNSSLDFKIIDKPTPGSHF